MNIDHCCRCDFPVIRFNYHLHFQGSAAILALKWIKPKGQFELNFHSQTPPTVSILSDGVYTNLEGTVVINSKEFGPESKSPLNISFSCAMILNVSLTPDPMKIKMKPIKVDLVLRSPGFNLTGVSKVVRNHFAKVFLPSLSSDLEFEPGFLESVLLKHQSRSQTGEPKIFEWSCYVRHSWTNCLKPLVVDCLVFALTCIPFYSSFICSRKWWTSWS